MGVESFYVKIRCNQIKDIDLEKKLNGCLEYSMDSEYCIIYGALVSFFPAVELIYRIINAIEERPFSIISLNQEIDYHFEKYIDFLNWMYKVWENKINYFNREFGAFIITPSLYYKTRYKLRKKYYKKI